MHERRQKRWGWGHLYQIIQLRWALVANLLPKFIENALEPFRLGTGRLWAEMGLTTSLVIWISNDWARSSNEKTSYVQAKFKSTVERDPRANIKLHNQAGPAIPPGIINQTPTRLSKFQWTQCTSFTYCNSDGPLQLFAIHSAPTYSDICVFFVIQQ